MKKKIILVQGIPGSGKTTWAKEWVNEDPENRVRINCDDIRRMSGPYWLPKREKYIWDLYHQIVATAMHYEKDIVIDNMNLNDTYAKTIQYHIDANNNNSKNIKYELETKLINTPLETCIERDAKREEPIGEKVIRQIYEQYKDILENEQK